MNIPYEFSFDTLISPKFMFNILLCEQSYLNYCGKIFLPVDVYARSSPVIDSVNVSSQNQDQDQKYVNGNFKNYCGECVNPLRKSM